MINLTRPKYFMPIHGEYRHLYANKDIGEFMGIPPENIFISEIGKVLEIDRKGARFNGSEPAVQVLVDGSGVGDIGSVVLRDRKHLAEDGLVVGMQNGLLTDELGAIVGRDKAVGCMIGFGATRNGPNNVTMTSLGEFYVGMLDGRTNKNLEEFAKMLSNGIVYSEIAAQTGLSTATISRVNHCLKYGTEGYHKIIERMKLEEKKSLK